MTTKENSLNRFEISVTDIGRAKKFYETRFSIEMPRQSMMGTPISHSNSLLSKKAVPLTRADFLLLVYGLQ